MIRIVFGMLVIGLATTACAPEIAEEPSSSVLVDTDSEATIPEGVTVHDVDHNSDGTINMDDLVIVGKFFGQDVPETGDLSMASGDTDESLVESARYYALIDFKKRFTTVKNPVSPPFLEDYNRLPAAKFAFRFIFKDTNEGIPRVIETQTRPVVENPVLKNKITQSLTIQNKIVTGVTRKYFPKMTIDGGGTLGEVYISMQTSSSLYISDHIKRAYPSIDPNEYLKKLIPGRDRHVVEYIMICAPRTEAKELYTDDKSIAESWGAEYFQTPYYIKYFTQSKFPPFYWDRSGRNKHSYYRSVGRDVGFCYHYGINIDEDTNPISEMSSDEVKAQYFSEDSN